MSASNSGVSTAAISRTHQSACPRISCKTPLLGTKCCDENCIIEIARRDCKSEKNHKEPTDISNDDAVRSPSDEEPCESHYQKAKEAYSGILENVGCICKVLVSLNFDSCCVDPPNGTLRTKRSTSSLAGGLLADIRKASNSRASSISKKSPTCSKNDWCTGESVSAQSSIDCEKGKATVLGAGKKPDDDCSKKSCCGTLSDVFNKSSAVLSVKCSGIENTGCCTAPSAVVGINDEPEVSVPKSCCSSENKITRVAAPASLSSSGSCCKENNDGCCPPDLKAKASRKIEICSDKTCCSEKLSISTTKHEIQIISIKAPATKSCCSDGIACENNEDVGRAPAVNGKNFQDSISEIPSMDGASENGCCSAALLTPEESLDTLQPPKYTSAATSGDVDLENGGSQVEHVVLSVQGMTCTGCESKLYRCLDMLPSISNVKTSLLLNQAEFDLRGIDIANTIKTIEKMTSFTCTKMTQSGHELDLIVNSFASDYANKDFPPGVSDIAVLDQHTIRITYHPKIVGARELMSDPFFNAAILAPVADRPLVASSKAHVRKMLFKTIVSTVLTIPVLVMAWAPLPPKENIYGAVSLVLATMVQIYIAGPWYISTFNDLFFSHLIEMDLLVVLSTTTAYIYSIVAYGFLVSKNPLPTGSFFETSTLLVTLIMLGRLVSGFARQRAVESISIESLQSSTVILLDSKTHEEKEIDARLLQYQDIFKALPDTTIATDGTVINGISEVDESMITGEATLVAKRPGSSVVAGSVNHFGTLTIRLSRLPGENTIKAIGLMVDEAKSSKTKIQDIADRVATYFIPVILAVTILVFSVWVIVGRIAINSNATTICINAMTYAISALIISCPCGIGLVVPMVLVVAGGVAAKHGLIFKTANTIEIARNLSHVIFDKTGTLTQGLLNIEVEIYPTKQGDLLRPMLLGITKNSKHPVSTAINAHLTPLVFQSEKVENVISIPGSGIEAKWNGNIIRAGNPHWLGAADSPSVKEILQLGVTMFCVLMNGELVAVFGLKDLLRPDAIRVINELKKRSIEVSIVSGDNEESVRAVASVLDIPESHVRFRCSPADKQVYVKEMLTRPKSVVMFCGDGTNDAVALASASIGMHIDGGTDIAQSAADAVLVRPALGGIIILMDLSKAYFRRVVINFSWSFIYNLFAILLAAGAFSHARIEPQYAGLGEIVSVLPVIVIAMQLKWARFHMP